MRQKKREKLGKLVKVLRKICGAYTPLILKKSGNLLNLLRSVDEEDAVKIADVSYKKTAKEKEIFPLGLNFGHEWKNKNSFYRIELRDNILYFVGTESEIIAKVSDKIDSLQSKNKVEKESEKKEETRTKFKTK